MNSNVNSSHNGKNLIVQQCTLYALSGRHLVYIVEEAEPGSGAQLGFFFLNSY